MEDDKFKRWVADDLVTFAGTVFKGTKSEYVELLKRELTGDQWSQVNGDLQFALDSIREFVKGQDKDYDHTWVAVHGNKDGEVRINDKMYNQNEVIEKIEALLKDLSGQHGVVSCYSNEKKLIETIQAHFPEGTISDKSGNCFVKFIPAWAEQGTIDDSSE